ncbi:transient receptor potential cation channel protein painless-like [Planococcus citri]|uniref:transient receptor potential cation channel protein painless-like n=1 Tax=Planococcus citri TaxID=170843 RepID=UPI0031FA06DB
MKMTNQEKLLSAFKERRIEHFRKLVKYRDIDVDYFYGEPDNGTLLDLAARFAGNEQYVFELIQSGSKFWRKDEETGKLVIHEIFNIPDRYLLYNTWKGIDVSSRSGNDNANIMKVAVEEDDIEAITRLARSYSVVHDSFDHDRSEAQQHFILLQGSIHAVRVFFKYFDVDKEFQKDSQGCVLSSREIILKKYPELKAELPKRSPNELKKILFSYLENGAPELFVNRIAEIDTEMLNDGVQEYTKLTYLHVACRNNYIDVVDALLKKNVHLNEFVSYSNEYAQNVTPIMLAVFYGHCEIFKKLAIIPEVELQNTDGSVLHLVLHGRQSMQDQNRSTDGHSMILELLLKRHDPHDYDLPTISPIRVNIEHTDENNRTALHYALKFNNEFAIKLLLRAGAKLYRKDQSFLTSISATIIEGYFDNCIRSSREFHWIPVEEDNAIIFNYKIFTQLDLYSIATKSKGNFFARFESVTEMRKLYKHPLTKSLLYLKWHLVRKYYYVNLAFYLSFCLALSTYIFQIQHCPPSSTNFNDSASTNTTTDRGASSIPCDVSLWTWLITFLLYIVLILRELCQFSVSIRRYIGMPENWLEMMMVVVIGFLITNDTNTHLSAIAILTSWIGLILLLGKQPSFSIYIEMFKTVASNFAKFLLLYSILVASFAYSFYILFRNKTSGHASSQNETNLNVNTIDRTNDNFMNSWKNLQMSFFKSIIMMAGEFEASTLPLDSNFSYGHVFFILFVFLVTMVLYNLLNGLAVSDTRAIMEDAEVVALISRAKLISQIERLAVRNPFSHAFKCGITEQLEKGYLFLRNKLFGDEILIDETERIYVYPTKSNRIEIDGKRCGKCFGKMPSTIVKHAEEILEKRKQSKPAKNQNRNSLTDVTRNDPSDSEHQSVASEQTSNLKLEIDAKIAARDEKLLQNVDIRFDKINKLLESVLHEVNLLKNKDNQKL